MEGPRLILVFSSRGEPELLTAKVTAVLGDSPFAVLYVEGESQWVHNRYAASHHTDVRKQWQWRFGWPVAPSCDQFGLKGRFDLSSS